jgi:hypothetical protein
MSSFLSHTWLAELKLNCSPRGSFGPSLWPSAKPYRKTKPLVTFGKLPLELRLYGCIWLLTAITDGHRSSDKSCCTANYAMVVVIYL